jgi:hypothetical protein
VGSGNLGARWGFVSAAASGATVSSSIPSARLEQQEQRWGWREEGLTFSEIASPQQMHIRGLMLSAVSITLHHETSPDNQGAALMLAWENISAPPRVNRDTGAPARHKDHDGCVRVCEGLMRLFLA